MSPKSSQDDTERQVLRVLRHAGYKRTTPLQKAAIPLALLGKDLVVEAEAGAGKTAAMLVPLLLQLHKRSSSVTRAVVLTDSSDQVSKLSWLYKRFASKSPHRPSFVAVGLEDNVRKELKSIRKHTDIVVGTTKRIIDHLRRDNLDLTDVEYVTLDVPDDLSTGGFDKNVLYINSKLSGKRQTVVYLSNLDNLAAFDAVLKRPVMLEKSEWKSAGGTDDPAIEEGEMGDSDNSKKSIESIVRKLKAAESPEILNYYRKLFRSSVPLNLRGYASAFLLKEYLGGDGAPIGGTKTLFVSIGKNRKVFPKDLSHLFCETLNIDQTLIGPIKILDNYSFVDIPEDKAENAIELLNGTEFRGRKLSVNHARKKRE